jgi:Protein of unknown function (DUF3631)
MFTDEFEDVLAERDPARLLDDVEQFLARFVAYPSEAARIAHVLWVAHAHLMGEWESTPRIAFLSPEPASGKSRALEVTSSLVPRPVHAVNCSPAYLFRKVSDPDGLPTILYDEIDTVFGPKAKDNEDIRGMLNAGHRRGATAGRCVVRGKQVFTEELPAYAPVALAGLDDLPDTIASRAVIVRMRRRAPGEHIDPWRARINEPDGNLLSVRLAEWAATQTVTRWPDMPEGIEDRSADVWEPLLTVAELAGGNWPARARVAAVTLVTDSRQTPRSMGLLLLGDLRTAFDDDEVLTTENILDKLVALDESPWSDLRGRALDARGLSARLRKYDDGNPEGPQPIRPTTVRLGDVVAKGYRRADFLDAWQRYLTPEPPTDAVTSDTPSGKPVTDVTALRPYARACRVCAGVLHPGLVEDTHPGCEP